MNRKDKEESNSRQVSLNVGGRRNSYPMTGSWLPLAAGVLEMTKGLDSFDAPRASGRDRTVVHGFAGRYLTTRSQMPGGRDSVTSTASPAR